MLQATKPNLQCQSTVGQYGLLTYCIIIIIIIIKNELELGCTVALLLQDHRTIP